MEATKAHWRSISQDPNCREVHDFIRHRISEAYAGCIHDELQFVQSFASDQEVLDIGVVAHTAERMDESGWKHALIKNAAHRTVGIDIMEKEVRILQGRGCDVRLLDATSDHDIGERFTRVVIGDVIEHVDNPVALLRFAKRHLNPGGQILCSTPNPFFVERVLTGFWSGWNLPNADHVAWITPTMALEIGCRAGLELAQVWHLRGRGLTLQKRAFIKAIEAIGVSEKECFASAFYYVFD